MLNLTGLDLLGRTNIQVALCGHGHNNRVLNYPASKGVDFNYPAIAGVMGRSNLRGGKGASGYNIITIADGKMSFQERTNGITKDAWHSIEISGPKQKEKVKEESHICESWVCVRINC